MNCIFTDWGLIPYQEAWDKQRQIAQQIVQTKIERKPTCSQIIFCEHPNVYTLGKNGHSNNLLINDDFLKKINAQFFHIDRGGDITYHGKGQIVGYPILDLEAFGLSLRQYIFNIEDIIIRLLNYFGITSGRLNGATGVWIDSDKPSARKICAIGVHASRHVTTHGFALNVNTDLRYYDHINPCGFTDKGVTSIEKELGKKIDMNEVKDLLKNILTNQLLTVSG